MRALSCSALVVILLAGCTSDPSADSPDGSGPPVAGNADGALAIPEEPAPTTCDGSLGAVEISGGLLVPRNGTCRLEGTAVDGRTSVARGASLLSKDARFGEGISAHASDRVVLRGGRAAGRPRSWNYAALDKGSNIVDFVFSGGRDVIIRDGPINGAFYIFDNTGRVEVSGLYLDLGRVRCSGNARTPVVSRISSETPSVLQGQCAGLKNFGQTDF